MRIGVFCSGGDAPGMNACLRSVVRSAVTQGHEVVGIRRGYQGLLDEDFFVAAEGEAGMTPRSVSNILQLGGTILRTSRCREFSTADGLRRATQVLQKYQIDALVPIGGDGSFRGAMALGKHWSGQIVGCPATIDNDLAGTDNTIGFSTAIATTVDCIDKLRDTAESHERLFLVEVMGRHGGFLALQTALAAGAEMACVPEEKLDAERISRRVTELKRLGKKSIVIVVAEGGRDGGVVALHEQLAQVGCPFSTRDVILGHIQRGGSPTPDDRILATRLGSFAVASIIQGECGVMTGVIAGRCVLTPFEAAVTQRKALPLHQLELLELMSC